METCWLIPLKLQMEMEKIFCCSVERCGGTTSLLQREEEDLPILEEVREAVKYLQHNKVSGEDGIPAELLQIGSEILKSLLHKLIVLI